MYYIRSVTRTSWLIFFIYLISLNGCKEYSNDKELFLPITKVLSDSREWASVDFEFLRLRLDPDVNSHVLAYLREGQIVEVIARSERKELFEKGQFYWYEIISEGLRGWVHGSYLNFTVSFISNDFTFESFLQRD